MELECEIAHWVTISYKNIWLPIPYQVIIWTNADLTLSTPYQALFKGNLLQFQMFWLEQTAP